jgi:HSP20 family protein
MAKTKSSFFERITGGKRLENQEIESMPVYSDEVEEEMIMRTSSTPIAREENWTATNTDAEGQLTIDVYQTEDSIVIRSTIAGVKPEDLDVSINSDMVTIKGERKNDDDVTAENYYYQECYWGPFSRSVVLPVDIISDKAEASLKNGILTIRLPKADVTKTKKIQVRGF